MPHPLQQKVQMLSRLARLLCLVRALGWTVVLVVITGTMLALADWLLYLVFRVDDLGLRTIFSAAFFLAALLALWRLVLPALITRWTETQIAQQVERHFPQLEDRLSSSIEFLRQPEADPTAGSPALRRSVVAETMAWLQQRNLYEAISWRPAMRSAAAGLLAASLVLLIVTTSHTSRLAARRLIFPWQAAQWPRRNHLVFENPPTRLAAGEALEVTLIDTQGRLPQSVDFHFRYLDQSRTETRPMKLLGDRMIVRLENVTRPLCYRATGGDDDSMPWYWLDVVDPPAVAKIQIKLTPPAYTSQPTTTSGNHIQALVGTRIELSGTASKPLKQIVAKVQCEKETRTVAGRVSADGTRFVVPGEGERPWVVDQSGSWWLELTDRQGLVGGKRQRWQLRAVPDNPPVVALERPPANLQAAAGAVVPLRVTVRDDLAIHTVELMFLASGSTDQGQQAVQLYRGPDRPPRPKSPTAAPADGAAATKTIQYQWDIAQLPGLEPGGTIRFHVAATDYKPQTGQSEVRQLTILAPEDLEDRLGQRQSYILGQLAEALRVQREARDQTRALSIQLDETGQLRQQDVDRLQSAELSQREVTRLLSAPDDGVEPQLVAVLADLRNNRLDSPSLQQRLTHLLTEVRRLNQQQLPRVDRQLISALKEARAVVQHDREGSASAEHKVPPAVRRPLAEAGSGQDEIIAVLERLIGQLSQWDSYRRIASQVRRIRRDQAELRQRAAELRPKLIGRTLQQLSPNERAELKILGQRQLELARQFDAAVSRLKQVQQQLAQQDPVVAQSVADALDTASRLAIAGHMRQSATEAEQNRLGRAIGLQQKVEDALTEMLDVLANRREQQLDRRLQQLEQAAGGLEQHRQRLEQLRRQLDEAARQQPPADQQQLQRLTRQLQQLSDEVGRLARRLQRLQAERAAEPAGHAQQQLGRAAQSAGQGDAASSSEQSQSAASELEQAQQQLAQTIQQVKRELFDEQRAKLQQQITGLATRQQAVIDETQRLDVLRRQGPLTPEQLASIRNLARHQQTVAQDTRLLAGKIEQVEALALALRGAATQMQRAAGQLLQGETGRRAQEAEQRALARLQQLLDALKSDNQNEAQGRGSQGGPAPQRPAAEMIQLLMQLKLLKAMQQSIRERTAELEEARLRHGGKLAEPEQQELEQLIAEQAELATVIFNLSQPVEENPEEDPDSLPEPNP